MRLSIVPTLLAAFACASAGIITSSVNENLISTNSLDLSKNEEEIASLAHYMISNDESQTSTKSKFGCSLCNLITGFSNQLLRQPDVREDISNALQYVCTKLNLYSPYICKNIVENFQNEVFYVLENLVVSPEEVCGIIIGDTCGQFYNPYGNWTIKIPPKLTTAPIQNATGQTKVLKVLHLTDLHHDPHYVEGSEADCKDPLCCRSINGFPNEPSKKAGKWGNYGNCDLPIRTLENMLGHISTSHKLDYIFWTGDFPAHDIWFQNKTTQLQSVQYIHDILIKYFPKTPVFPSLGNHESNPVDSFPPPSVKGKYSISWLYEKLNQTWSTWIDTDKISGSIVNGAYYSISPTSDYRIISLNMNYCNNLNWWLLINMTDPAGELEWLAQELFDAEKLGQKVHIIGHIPPNACPEAWGENYNNIINRFKDIIMGTFFGHTHKDELNIHYEGPAAEKQATAVAYVAPSGTTYGSLNPAYRIYDVDNSNWAVLDHVNYFLNITEANLNDDPKWLEEYSAKKTYGMQNLTPTEWDKVVGKFKTDRALFDKYMGFYYHKSDIIRQCDEKCRQETICTIQTARSGSSIYC